MALSLVSVSFCHEGPSQDPHLQPAQHEALHRRAMVPHLEAFLRGMEVHSEGEVVLQAAGEVLMMIATVPAQGIRDLHRLRAVDAGHTPIQDHHHDRLLGEEARLQEVHHVAAEDRRAIAATPAGAEAELDL